MISLLTSIKKKVIIPGRIFLFNGYNVYHDTEEIKKKNNEKLKGAMVANMKRHAGEVTCTPQSVLKATPGDSGCARAQVQQP